MRKVGTVAIALMVTLGCGGRSITQSAEPAEGSAGVDGTAVGGGASGGAEGGAATTALSQCGKQGDVVHVKSDAEVKALIVGKWLHCPGFVIFGVPHVGLEFAAGGHWYFLNPDGNGQLARQPGFNGGGDWTLHGDLAMTSEYVAEMGMGAATGASSTNPVFQVNPSAMRLSTPVGSGDYVAAE